MLGTSIRILEELGSGWVEPKIDGMRVKLNPRKKIALSRNEKPVNLPSEIFEHFPDEDIWFDGEVTGLSDGFYGIGKAKSKMDLDSMGQVLVYWVFDVIMDKTYEQRKEYLRAVIKENEVVRLVPYWYSEKEDLKEWLDRFLAEGWEGLMWKKPGHKYEDNRSENWIKVKPFQTDEFKIVGFIEGSGRNKGRLGALVVDIGNGKKCRVGGGYSDFEREEIWMHREELKGKIVEVKFQTRMKNSLRHPCFVRFRPDKD